MRRRTQLLVGSVLTTVGVAGLVGTASLAPVPLHAAAPSAEGQAGTDQMMQAVRGVDAVNGMHAMPGAEDMVQACSAMMRARDPMKPPTGDRDMMGERP